MCKLHFSDQISNCIAWRVYGIKAFMKKLIFIAYFVCCGCFGADLTVRWLGTNSYLIQFGHVSVLTDPFYSQAGLFQTGLGTLRSDPHIVREVVSRLKRHPKPSAIFIGHSHYDHMLDTAELLRQANWPDVPVYGSRTTYNILSGYGKPIARHFRPTIADRKWRTVAPNVRYMAIPSEHASQLPGVFFYPGSVNKPRQTPPTKAADFLLGNTYVYLFELTDGKEKAVVYFTGAATRPQHGLPGPDVPRVDAAILCVPSWQYTHRYPEAIIQRLRPRYIIPAHYNDFFQSLKSFNQPRSELWLAGLQHFLKHVKAASHYVEFRRTIVLKVGEQVLLP